MYSNSIISFIVSKEESDSVNLTNLNKLIKQLEGLGKQGQGRLVIAFDGYDNIPDEIFEIPKIRKYVSKVFNRFPHLLYFLNPLYEETTDILLACLGNVETLRNNEKKSPNEYFEEGYSFKDLPKLIIEVKIPNYLLNIVRESTIKYGNKVGDPEGALKSVSVLDKYK